MAEQTTAKNPLAQLRDDDGLFLTGLVVAVDTLDKSWENKNYRQLKATITNGRSSFTYLASDTQAPLPTVLPFQRARVEVESARSEKGMMTVRGKITQANN